jgi:hypothetical protein
MRSREAAAASGAVAAAAALMACAVIAVSPERLNMALAAHGTSALSWQEASARGGSFECGGEQAAARCRGAVSKCAAQAEEATRREFKTQPRIATERRAERNCRCFVSNGCTPSCNVAMFMLWSADTGMRCKSKPPVFLAQRGVYLYGDAARMLPSDVSFDYFPDFPNPSGHIMNVPDVRSRFAEDPRTWHSSPLFVRAGTSRNEWPTSAPTLG